MELQNDLPETDRAVRRAALWAIVMGSIMIVTGFAAIVLVDVLGFVSLFIFLLVWIPGIAMLISGIIFPRRRERGYLLAAPALLAQLCFTFVVDLLCAGSMLAGMGTPGEWVSVILFSAALGWTFALMGLMANFRKASEPPEEMASHGFEVILTATEDPPRQIPR